MNEGATLTKAYDPKTVEQAQYAFWEEGDYFRPEAQPDGEPYCITIPPPNVTGELHMGHALQHAIHDAMIRWKRMQGYRTLCLPGTDHAGIATQMRVEQQLYKSDGKSRHDVGRDEMLARIWEWRGRYGSTILQQLKELGCSYDWSRERFTMDEGYVRAVMQAFVRFYEKGWIYRGQRMVNWCPFCGTVISDLEVEERELQGHLWHIRYPGREGGPDVVVATTRPETMLGDTGVAVHPRDARWADAVGGQVTLPLMERAIPIVADEYADPEMGSGAVKVTPAHDPNDHEVGARHGLPDVQVIGFDATMTGEAGRFSGLERYACRDAVVDALQAEGLVERIEDHLHAVPHHDKCGTVIEPLLMEQWFVAMRELADQALPALREGAIAYVPDRFRGYTVDWLESIRDWCISRQIWWGHRIPVWTCEGCGEVTVQEDAPDRCGKCESDALAQDPDVLDTWFSSALWPFATLGWPDDTADRRTYHPTDLMVTGRDILYLWVVRMAMTSLEFTDEIPFRTVLVHPTVQTRDGRRMSKSLGTGVDPRELIERYGADATRLSLLYQCGSSQDIRFDADVVDNHLQDSPITEMCRNFCNKVWNASRFVQMHLDGYESDGGLEASYSDLADRWILSQYNHTIDSVTASLGAYRFDEASRALYEFVWNSFCDWYVEMAKVRLSGEDSVECHRVQGVLVHVLEGICRLLHPMVPYVTEALWQELPHSGEALIVAAWPESDVSRLDDAAERDMAIVQEVVGAVRNIRGTMCVPPGRRADLLLRTSSETTLRILEETRTYICELARADGYEVGADLARPPGSASAVVSAIEVYVPLKGLIDVDVEKHRLMKEIDGLEKALSGLDKKLENEGFLKNAPAEVVETERRRHQTYRETLDKLQDSLAALTA